MPPTYRQLPIAFTTALLISLVPSVVQAALSLEIRDERVYLDADNVSLISILSKVADQTGVYVQSVDPLTKPVSIKLAGLPVDHAIEQLLKGYSYTLKYTKLDEHLSRLQGVTILRKTAANAAYDGPAIEINPAGTQVLEEQAVVLDGARLGPPDHGSAAPPSFSDRGFEKNWLEQQLSDVVRIAQELEIDDNESLPAPDLKAASQTGPAIGVRVRSITDGSILSQMGFKGGDLVKNVNGKAVNGRDDLVLALKEAATDSTVIRIDRRDQNGHLSMIYVRLDGSSESQGAP
jgi:membrane-associated protease RseP (regulator of RpoE activity)